MKTLVKFIKESTSNEWVKYLERAVNGKNIKNCVRIIKDMFGNKLVEYDVSLFDDEEDEDMTVIALSPKDPNYFLVATKESGEQDYVILYTEDKEIIATLDITATNYMDDVIVYVEHNYSEELHDLIDSLL